MMIFFGIIFILTVLFLIVLLVDNIKHPKEWAEHNAKAKELHQHKTITKIENGVEKICCPKCGYTDLYTGKRGWKITTGFYGSSKIINTCKKCGYHWETGK